MLCNATEWDGVLSWDAFSRRIYWASEPPQVQTAAIMPKVGAEFTDLDLIYVGHALAMRYGPSFGSEPLLAAVTLAARKRPCHPVKAFLETEPWDGVDRLSTWLTVYLGAVDSPINRSIGRWWLISAVARIYQPGCQADHVVVLEGRQGIGKSRAIACLAADWYLPRLPPINDKDAMQILLGRWIVEIAELEAFRGQAWSGIKDYLSRSIDVFREPYGRSHVSLSRTCVFAGSTNQQHYSHDHTGARRLWPVQCGRIDRDALLSHRQQLWAQALTEYRSGSIWYPNSASAISQLSDIQDDRFERDEWESFISDWIDRSNPSQITMSIILEHALSIEPKDWDRAAQTRIGNILHRLSWEKRRVRIAGKLAYMYVHGKSADTAENER
jgi:putative DNA primase/helicase